MTVWMTRWRQLNRWKKINHLMNFYLQSRSSAHFRPIEVEWRVSWSIDNSHDNIIRNHEDPPELTPNLRRKSTFTEFGFSPIAKYREGSNNSDTSSHPKSAHVYFILYFIILFWSFKILNMWPIVLILDLFLLFEMHVWFF